MHIRIHRVPVGVSILLLTLLCCCLVQSVPADDPADPRPSLDQQLLDDLDDDLLEDLPDTLRQNPFRVDSEKRQPSDLDRRLLDELEHGEDVGQAGEDPLASIQRQMRHVERLIARQETSESTQDAQRRIIHELQTLIEQQKKKCSGGSCDKPSTQSANKPSNGKKKGSGENQGNSKPSSESEDRLGQGATEDAKLDRMKRMLKQVWGHLPPKVQQQLTAGAAEQFLPKYEALIEEYYRRLAEESSQ